MARRRFLVAYDISDPKRLRQVCKIAEAYGERLQYSVFICDLSPSELLRARVKIEERMLMTQDSVVIVDLGAPSSGAKIHFIGRRRPLPETGSRIV